MSPRDAANSIVATLQHAGHQAFFVGGCVRDQLLGLQPDDFDIATSALPDQIEALFHRVRPVGRKFGVLLVFLGGRAYQVATFRSESGYADGRRPGQVRFTNAQEDAARRDFTINGLFFDPVSSELHDWVGGRRDLSEALIRTIGQPGDRFQEDHLRMLRAVRLAAQLDFRIETATLEAIQQQARSIHRISAERIRDELRKLLSPPHAARGLDGLRSSLLLPEVLPEVQATVECTQSPDYHPEGTVYQHIRLMLEHLPPGCDPLLPWAVLLHDIAKPLCRSVDGASGRISFHGHEKRGAEVASALLRRLRFPAKDIERIAQVVRYHMQFKDIPNMRKATLRRMILRTTFPLELEHHRLDCLGSHGRLDHYDLARQEWAALAEKPGPRTPLLTGEDLLKLGMRSGPQLGALLAEAREKQLQDELRTREEALAWAAQHCAPSQPPIENPTEKDHANR